jgi:hypothetical protein
MSNKNPNKGLDPAVIEKARIAAAKYFNETNAASDRLIQQYEEINELENRIAKARGASKKALQETLKEKQQDVKQTEALEKANKRLTNLYEEQFNGYNDILNAKLDVASIDKTIIQLQQERQREINADNIGASDALKIAIKAQQAYKAQIPYLQRVQDSFGGMNDMAQDLASSVQNAFAKIPGGKYLAKMLGIDKLGDVFKKSLSNAAAAFIKSGGGIKGTIAAIKEFGGGLKGMFSPFTLGVAALAGMYMLLQKMNKEARAFAKTTGLSVTASQQLVKQSYAIQTSAENQLSSQADILKVQEVQISKLGAIGQLSGETALRVSEIGNAFGYGAETAAEVQAVMMQISGMSEQSAIEAQEFANKLALAEGVAPGAVMKDIKENAEVAAKYFAGNATSLGKAGVQAAKLGMSISQMANTAKSLLNIEQSLEDQFVASAMLGRQLNFDTARRLVANGKIGEAMEEVLTQMGGIEEFENASIFAKERMAAAAGMTVEQLSKSLSLQAKAAELSEDEFKTLNGMNLTKEEISKKNPAELKAMAQQAQATEAVNKSFEKIKNSLTTAILPVAEKLLPIFKGLALVIGFIGVALTPIFDTLTGIMGIASIIGVLFGGTIDQLSTMQWILGAIAGIYLAIQGYALATQIIEGIKLGYAAREQGMLQKKALLEQKGLTRAIGLAVMKAYANVGPIVGTIVAGGIIALGYKFMNDGEISPVGPSGYSRVLSGPEGSIALNDKDTIIAGTNLNQGAGGGGGVSVISKESIDALIEAIQKLKIIIDDSAVGAIAKQGAVLASYR